MRLALAVPAVALAVLLAACGSSDDGGGSDATDSASDRGTEPDGPKRGSLEAIVEALNCEEDDFGSDADVLYSCFPEDNDDLSAVYIYLFEAEGGAEEYAVRKAEQRASETDPRGLAWHEDWVLDTGSAAALEVAEEQGATVLVPVT